MYALLAKPPTTNPDPEPPPLRSRRTASQPKTESCCQMQFEIRHTSSPQLPQTCGAFLSLPPAHPPLRRRAASSAADLSSGQWCNTRSHCAIEYSPVEASTGTFTAAGMERVTMNPIPIITSAVTTPIMDNTVMSVSPILR
jgi:hypothetical protein